MAQTCRGRTVREYFFWYLIFIFSKVVADDLMRVQLNTMDEERVVAFEADPCAMVERYAAVAYNGAYYNRYDPTVALTCR